MIQAEQATDLLRRWAALAPAPRPPVDWTPAQRLIEAVGPKLQFEAKRLSILMKQSREKLKPLDDPFDLDMGLHHWLDDEREGAYSDWLEWIVRQAKTAERIFRLFGLESPPDDLRDGGDAAIKREFCVPHGHVDHAGRLDLVIRFGGHTIIIVEVKVGGAESADTAKQQGYSRWLAKQKFSNRHSIFLAVSAEGETYHGFTFFSWANVCVEMRRLATEIANEGRISAAALVLAYVGAVEQNLLGFSFDSVQRICRGRARYFNPWVVEHMERFVTDPEV
jgi:hypothetical protein